MPSTRSSSTSNGRSRAACASTTTTPRSRADAVDRHDQPGPAGRHAGADSSLKLSDNLFTGKIGVVYKPAKNGSIYAAYGTSAQPPGGANFSLSAAGTGNSAARTDFLPQKAKTFEIGTKWDVLNDKLSLTGAIYRTDVSNEVVQDPTNTSAYYQSGKKRVQGIELGAGRQPSPTAGA
jgi:outer membrane receptor for monomeric catechols